MVCLAVPRGSASFPQMHRFSASERCRLVSAKGLPYGRPIVLVSGPPLGLALAVALFLALL